MALVQSVLGGSGRASPWESHGSLVNSWSSAVNVCRRRSFFFRLMQKSNGPKDALHFELRITGQNFLIVESPLRARACNDAHRL
jgi:hypothetical protein